jgi:hypothetical protein
MACRATWPAPPAFLAVLLFDPCLAAQEDVFPGRHLGAITLGSPSEALGVADLDLDRRPTCSSPPRSRSTRRPVRRA